MMRKIYLMIMLLISTFTLVSCLEIPDTVDPMITGTHDFTLPVDSTKPNWLEGVTATDDVDGEISVEVNDILVDLTSVGSYDLYYKAVDKAGNECLVIVVVEVVENETNYLVQGITDHEIYVGNTTVLSGSFSAAGIPYYLGMQVAFDDYNTTHEGRNIEMIHYDDKYSGSNALTYTQKLVEDDRVFALVGQFGNAIINSTIDYIKDVNIPFIAPRAFNNLFYNEYESNDHILPVLPFLLTEGQMMVARALHESLFGPDTNRKLGVDDDILILHSDDEVSSNLLSGINQQLTNESVNPLKVTRYQMNQVSVSFLNEILVAFNPKVILLATSNQYSMLVLTALRELGSTIPVISSSMTVQSSYENSRFEQEELPYKVYYNQWMDYRLENGIAPTVDQVGHDGELLFYTELPEWSGMSQQEILNTLTGYTTEYWEFVKLMNDSNRSFQDTVARSLWQNKYAMEGYIAAKAFIAILERVDHFETLTWDLFIDLAKTAPIDLPLTGTIEWSNQTKNGIEMFSFNELVYSPSLSFTKIMELESITSVSNK